MPWLIINRANTDPLRIPLSPGLYRVGRDEENQVVIDDPSISRFHCELEVTVDGTQVRDLDSANGTYVDDDLMSMGQLKPGQRLTLGSVTLKYEGDPVATHQAPVKTATAKPLGKAGARVRPETPGSAATAPLGTLLGGALAYPYYGNGTLILIIGALLFSVAYWAALVAQYALLLGFFAVLFITIFTTGYLFNYMQRIALSTINGEGTPPGWPPIESAWNDLVIPAMRLWIIWLFSVAPGLYVSANVSLVLGTAVLLLGLFCMPMMLLTVSLADGIVGLNPVIIWSGIAKVLGPYLAVFGLVMVFFLVRTGLGNLLDYSRLPLLPTLVENFIMLYGLTALMRAMGLLYVRYRDRLAWFNR